MMIKKNTGYYSLLHSIGCVRSFVRSLGRSVVSQTVCVYQHQTIIITIDASSRYILLRSSLDSHFNYQKYQFTRQLFWLFHCQTSISSPFHPNRSHAQQYLEYFIRNMLVGIFSFFFSVVLFRFFLLNDLHTILTFTETSNFGNFDSLKGVESNGNTKKAT